MSKIVFAIVFFFCLPVGAEQLLITNVVVWDGTAEELTEQTSVLIENNIIKEIGAVTTAENADLIDGGGRTLMPGLISSHVHLTHAVVDGGVQGLEAMTWEEIGARAVSVAEECVHH